MPRRQNESFCNFICTFVVMQIKVITHTDACSVNRFARGPVLKQRQKAIRVWPFFLVCRSLWPVHLLLSVYLASFLYLAKLAPQGILCYFVSSALVKSPVHVHKL